MSESKQSDKMSWASSWLTFLTMRREMEQLVKDLELSNFSLNFGIKSEHEFHEKLRQMEILVQKMIALVGPEAKPIVG